MQTQGLTQDDNAFLSTWWCLLGGKAEGDAGKSCCTFPSRKRRNNLCSGAVGSQENAGKWDAPFWDGDAEDFSQDCRSDMLPYVVPWFNQDLDWLTVLLTEVEIRYKHFRNL